MLKINPEKSSGQIFETPTPKGVGFHVRRFCNEELYGQPFLAFAKGAAFLLTFLAVH